MPPDGSRDRDQGYSLTALAEPESLDQVHRLLEALWASCADIALTDRVLFETAVTEIAGNIAQHAGDGRPLEFSLQVQVHPDRLEARFRDTGRRAEIDLDDTTLPDDLAESGRGLAMTLRAADELEYRREDGVNHWRVARHRRPAGRVH